MKMGEVCLGTIEPKQTSPIFMLKFLIIWSLLKGVNSVKPCICVPLHVPPGTTVNHHLILVDLNPV